MANINQISPDGGTTVYDIEDPTARSSINSLTPRVGIAEGKITTLQEQMHSVQNSLGGLGTASTKNSTSVVTESSDLVESGAVFDAIGWGNKNLLDPSNLTRNGDMRYTPIFVGDTDVTLSTDAPLTTNAAVIFLIEGNVSGGASSANNGVSIGAPRTVTAINGYITIASRMLNDIDIRNYNSQLEKGSTATAYEPYHASVEESLDDKLSYADNGVLGAKNRLSYTLDKLKSYNQNGTWNGNAYTINGVTYTINSDNSITINGTQNGSDYGSDLYLCGANTNDGRILVSPFLNNQKLSVGVAVDYDKLRIGFWYYDSNKSYTGTTNTIPNGEKQVVLNPPSNAVYTTQYIRVTLNSIVSNLTIYPMLYAKDDTDDTYRNYAQTNRELTVNKTDNSVIGTVEDGATASQAYAVNDVFIRNGALCKVTSAISQGDTLSNQFTVTNVGAILTALLNA